MLEAGDLGEVLHVRCAYLPGLGRRPERVEVWRFDAGQAGSRRARRPRAPCRRPGAVPGRRDRDGRRARRQRSCPVARRRRRGGATCAFAGGAIGTLEATRFATGSVNRFTLEINGSSARSALRPRATQRARGRRPARLPPDPRHRARAPFAACWWPPGHGLGWEHTFVPRVGAPARRDRRDGRTSAPCTGPPSRTGCRAPGLRRDRRIRARGPGTPSRGLRGVDRDRTR